MYDFTTSYFNKADYSYYVAMYKNSADQLVIVFWHNNTFEFSVSS